MEGGSGEGLPVPQKTISRRKLVAGMVGAGVTSAIGGFAIGRRTREPSPTIQTPTQEPTTTEPPPTPSTTTEPQKPAQTTEPNKPTLTAETPKTTTGTTVESTEETDEIIEEEASPTATPTETKKKKRTLKEVLADADMDKEKMRELYNNNTRIITNPWDALSDPKLSGEWLPDGFGSGWCLAGVRYSLQLTGIAIEDLKGIGSAYKAEAILDNHPELFQKLNLSRKSIPSLPPGTILVYEPNQDSDPGGGTYDMVDGVHHGHISIIRGRNDQKEVMAGSDHEELLAKDMSLMHHKIYAYVIKNPSSAS